MVSQGRRQARQLSAPVMAKHAKDLTIRLLVCGERQVGKSASIVRYTTGRFIEEYCKTTDHWLYRHFLGSIIKQQGGDTSSWQVSVELMEQKDVPFDDPSELLGLSLSSGSSSSSSSSGSGSASGCELKGNQRVEAGPMSLSLRVACEQELREKQEFVKKLRWANAYLIVYAIDNAKSFEKASKYLSLIQMFQKQEDRKVQHRLHQQRHKLRSLGSGYNQNQQQQQHQSEPLQNQAQINQFPASSRPLNTILSSNERSSFDKEAFCGRFQASGSGKQQNQLGPLQRPTLLLANKLDLHANSRKVSFCDGQFKAMEFEVMFAEISAASSRTTIDSILSRLVEQVDPANCQVQVCSQPPTLTVGAENSSQSRKRYLARQPQTTRPQTDEEEIPISMSQRNLIVPIWGQLVRSTQATCNVASSSRIEQRAMRGLAIGTGDSALMRPNRVSSSTLGASFRLSSIDSNATDCSSISDFLGVANHSQADSLRSASSASGNTGNSLANSCTKLNHWGGQTRYKSLKSSFKRASMAIVSSKSLLRDAKSRQQSHPKPLLEQEQTNSVVSTSNHNSNGNSTESLSKSAGSRLKRTLFKYKDRCKTVAFHEVEGNKREVVSNLVCQAQKLQQSADRLMGSAEIQPMTGSLRNSLNDTHKNCDSQNHHSALYVSPVLARSASDRAPSSASGCSGSSNSSNSGNQQRDRRLLRRSSRASTSAGSYDESGDDQASSEAPSSLSPIEMQRAYQLPPLAPIVSTVIQPQQQQQLRHPVGRTSQIVRTFSSYLAASTSRHNKLQKATPIPVKQLQPQLASSEPQTRLQIELISQPKRGFCSTLFKSAQHTSSKINGAGSKAETFQLDQTVQRPIAHLVGYCK